MGFSNSGGSGRLCSTRWLKRQWLSAMATCQSHLGEFMNIREAKASPHTNYISGGDSR